MGNDIACNTRLASDFLAGCHGSCRRRYLVGAAVHNIAFNTLPCISVFLGLAPYQINSFVLGLEFDLDGATGSKYANAALTNVPEGFVSPAITRSAQQLDWRGTLRARIGWTPIDRVLIFGTGGLAFGHSSASITEINAGAVPPEYATAYGTGQVGWTAGGGIEYALPDKWANWSVKVEYLYYDLGQKTGTITYQDLDLINNAEYSSLSG